MTHKQTILTGLVLATVGCATNQSSREVVPREEVPAAVSPFVYANGMAQYLYTTQRITVQEVGGQSTRAENVVGVRLSTVIAQNTAARSVRFSIDSVLEASGPGLTAPLRRAVTGLMFEGTLEPNGAVTGLSGDGERSALMALVTSAMQQFLPRIPTNGAEPGMTWADTTLVESNDGSTRIARSAVVYSTAGDWTDDRTVLPITWHSEYTLEGEGQQMGQNFTLTGSGLTRGEHKLSVEGVYLGSSARDSSSAEVLLPAFGITVPITSTAIDSVAVIR